MTSRSLFFTITCLLMAGCASLAGKPTVSSSCSFEQAWDAVAASLSDFPLQTVDKASGALETSWVEAEASTQAGLLGREVNRERFKYVVEVNADGRGVTAGVAQLREEWSPMGVQSRQWRAVPGNPSEEAALASAISKRLKEKGC